MQGGSSLVGRLLLGGAVALLAGCVLMPAPATAARPPLGKYTCIYPPFFTPHPLKLVSKTKYTVDKTRKSAYAVKRGKIDFRKGAYSDFYGRYEAGERRIVIYDKETDARLWNCDRGS